MKEVLFEHTAEFKNLKTVMKRLIALPKTELDEQIRLHEGQSKLNPSRPGPKPKMAQPKT
jgi:hypothetical protein